MTYRRPIERWVDDLFTAWREADAARAASLFTDDAEYRFHPFRPPLEGRAQIQEYWSKSVASQEDLELHVGAPVSDGRRAAVEWWVSVVDHGVESVSYGTLFLIFVESGLCRSLREVWMEHPGRQDPYPGWGT